MTQMAREPCQVRKGIADLLKGGLPGFDSRKDTADIPRVLNGHLIARAQSELIHTDLRSPLSYAAGAHGTSHVGVGRGDSPFGRRTPAGRRTRTCKRPCKA